MSADAGRDDGNFAGLGLERRKAEGFQLGRQQEHIGNAEVIGDVRLFADKYDIVVHAELLRPVSDGRTLRAVADHHEPGIRIRRSLNLREDLDAVDRPLDRHGNSTRGQAAARRSVQARRAAAIASSRL